MYSTIQYKTGGDLLVSLLWVKALQKIFLQLLAW